MNVKGIKRAEDWDFPMPEFLEDAINNLVDAWARDDENIDCYLDEVHGCARGVDEYHDAILRDYYTRGGWRDDVVD